ncbi:MAG: hypothetical protein ABIR64_03650 [Candidatus Limnocylindrales bacterium]
MIQSQFNLDHRLDELRQTGTELRRERAARAAGQPRTIGTAIRSLFANANASSRPAGVTAAWRL